MQGGGSAAECLDLPGHERGLRAAVERVRREDEDHYDDVALLRDQGRPAVAVRIEVRLLEPSRTVHSGDLERAGHARFGVEIFLLRRDLFVRARRVLELDQL